CYGPGRERGYPRPARGAVHLEGHTNLGGNGSRRDGAGGPRSGGNTPGGGEEHRAHVQAGRNRAGEYPRDLQERVHPPGGAGVLPVGRDDRTGDEEEAEAGRSGIPGDVLSRGGGVDAAAGEEGAGKHAGRRSWREVAHPSCSKRRRKSTTASERSSQTSLAAISRMMGSRSAAPIASWRRSRSPHSFTSIAKLKRETRVPRVIGSAERG